MASTQFNIEVVDCTKQDITITDTSNLGGSTKEYEFVGGTGDKSDVISFTETYEFPADCMNACSIDHYRITCTDPNNDTLVHENGSSTGSSTLCDKFEFETDPNSANGRYIKVNEANYPDVLADKLAHLGSYVIRM